MTASAIVLMIAVGILPAYGITMMIIDQLSRKLHFLRPWVVDRAAVIYLVFLAIGNALVIVEGFIPIGAIVFKTWWGALLSIVLAPIVAMVPYLLELLLSSAIGSVERATLATAVFIRDANSSVNALIERHGVWWTVAIGTALMEELLFRGALLHAVWSEHGALFAILANSIIFGLHHVAFGINAIFAKMIAGLLWSLLVLLGGSIIAALAAHLFFQYLVWRRSQRIRVSHAM